MAKDYWEDPAYWDDECCMGCGESHYAPSRTPGLCRACLSPDTASQADEDWQEHLSDDVLR